MLGPIVGSQAVSGNALNRQPTSTHHVSNTKTKNNESLFVIVIYKRYHSNIYKENDTVYPIGFDNDSLSLSVFITETSITEISNTLS